MQYIQDTRGEMHHVAWPTQAQTFVYTVLIAGISVFVAAYLGFFDFLFTTGLAKGLNVKASTQVVTEQPLEATADQTVEQEQNFNTNLGGTPITE